jgi:hypothetical protein
MSGAAAAVRAGVLAALRADAVLQAELNGVFDGPQVRASAPYAEVGEALTSDWGTKDARGREVRVAVLVRDLAERPERLGRLVDAAERAVEDLARDLPGWRVASAVFLRARVAGEGPGRWLAVAEWRVRVLEG